MPSLPDNIRNHIHWLVFVVLEAVSLTLLFRFSPYHNSVWFSRMVQLHGRVAEWQSQVEHYARMQKENEQLTQRNITLQQNVQALRTEIRRLTHQPDYTETSLAERVANLTLIPAKVCDNSVSQRDNMMLINRGSRHGVRPEQGVISGTGVVGIVRNVSEGYAQVLPLLNSRSSISCRIRGSEYFGYLHWTGGNPLLATLDDVPPHARVKVGDAVETSGFSNIFPEGIFVGRVEKLGFSPDGQSLKIYVRLSNDLANVRDVTVIVNNDIEDMLEATNTED